MLPGPAQLHLWLARRDAVVGNGEFLRAVLSRYTGLAPAELRFSRGEHGKPALQHPPIPLSFNLSDSADQLALAVGSGAPIGIDLEYCDPAREVLRLARRCFSSAEQAALLACDPAGRKQLFYDFWTLKEAHVKAAGGSLGRELESTCFELDYTGAATGGDGAGRIRALTAHPAGPAWYGLLEPLPDYRLALCCASPVSPAPDLRLFEWLPGGPGNELPARLRAASAEADGSARLVQL